MIPPGSAIAPASWAGIATTSCTGAPEMQDFLAILHDNIAEVGRAYQIDTKQVGLELATCWIIINGKFASGAVHCHPNAFLSGVYYISAAENCGDIFFQDPRHAALMGACPVTEHAPGRSDKFLPPGAGQHADLSKLALPRR